MNSKIHTLSADSATSISIWILNNSLFVASVPAATQPVSTPKQDAPKPAAPSEPPKAPSTPTATDSQPPSAETTPPAIPKIPLGSSPSSPDKNQGSAGQGGTDFQSKFLEFSQRPKPDKKDGGTDGTEGQGQDTQKEAEKSHDLPQTDGAWDDSDIEMSSSDEIYFNRSPSSSHLSAPSSDLCDLSDCDSDTASGEFNLPQLDVTFDEDSAVDAEVEYFLQVYFYFNFGVGGGIKINI